MSYKEIQLLCGKTTKIDLEDYKVFSQQKWSATYDNKSKKWYVKRTEKGKTIILAREIMKCPKKMVVDHVNGDTLDNRKKNLRICTHEQNTQNFFMKKDNKSGYKGVFYEGYSYRKNLKKKWNARISYKNKVLNLGYFLTKEEAARAYNEASLKYHGVYGQLNSLPIHP